MDRNTVILFTRNGLGDAPAELQQGLVTKFLTLTLESGELPGKILFYTEGVRLVCEGSAVISQLKEMEKRGVELVICQTCLNFFNLTDKVQVGIVGGMGDILTTLQKAARVLSV